MLGGLVYKVRTGAEYVLTHVPPDTQHYALKAATQTVPCDDFCPTRQYFYEIRMSKYFPE